MKREASDTSESPAPAFIISQPSNDVAAEILPPEQDASPSDHKRPWKRWCLVAAVLALVISIPVGWTLRVHDLNIPGPTISTQVCPASTPAQFWHSPRSPLPAQPLRKPRLRRSHRPDHDSRLEGRLRLRSWR